ncbi:unnamed protein product [Phytophthora fragariaefolia]|uniref:Unnamed protein product n=1 Tax=Phytophthora fragariaefolia TaxID=1490495 RepID=A0A9W6U392_9STRA|nr:unnamed protein product [Phytophthora fragariaefolia]
MFPFRERNSVWREAGDFAMFEKVVESVLEEYVSEWVEGLDSEKMKVALFAGKVEFRDLRMRGAALDKFKLPMKMKSGSVGRLSIKVPWKRLTSQAVKIKVEDVFLVVEPTDQDEARTTEEDDDSYALRTRWAKQQEVRMFELLETVKNDGSTASESEGDGTNASAVDSDPTASWGYRKKILNTILDNVSFEFSNIHVRYEDSKHLASSIPLALGLTIDSIVISTTNANGQEEFVDRAHDRTAFVHRRLEMVQASVYGDHIEALGAQGRKGPSTSGSNIIHPFSTRINLARNHDQRTASTIPKLRCSAEISAIRTCLTPQQSTFLISIADFVSAHEMYLKRLHFQRKRPAVPVRSNAKLWWQYALRGVLELHHHALSSQKTPTTAAGGETARKSSIAHRRCNWKLFTTLWFARKEYIRLHKNMLRAAKKKKLDIESVMADRARLNALEDALEVPTIVFFRICAVRELELEGQGNDSPRKLSQWKSKFSTGRASSSSNASISTRESFLDKLDIYLAVNERMHASSEARTASFHEERNVEALLMALDLVVVSFEVVLVEEYNVGDKSDTRDFLRFELNEFVVTVLQRSSSSTFSSRITSVQILDFRQTYEAVTLEKKEPQALLSMIDTIAPNGQAVSRKNPFVELNIESSENKFQLDCTFERFRYIHNLYATSKLRAYFIARVDEPAEPIPSSVITLPTPPKPLGKISKLPAELQLKTSIENVFGNVKARRRSDVRSRTIPTREVLFSVKVPEVDVFIHTTVASAEVEARLVGTHFQNGAAHSTFELSIEEAEAYFLEPEVSVNVSDGQEVDADDKQRKRSTLMQSTRLVFYGEKLIEGYLIPKWQMKCTAPPLQFSMSSKQYQQLLQASAEWQSPKNEQETTHPGSSTHFVVEDERLNVCFSIPQILIDFSGEGPIQAALSAASSASEVITGFELDIRDLNVMARFSSIAQAATIDLGLLSLTKRMTYRTVTKGEVDDFVTNDTSPPDRKDQDSTPVPAALLVSKSTSDSVYDQCTGHRTPKLFEFSGKTNIMISSSKPFMGEANIEQVALYWDHELLVALVQYHSKSLNASPSTSDETPISQSVITEQLARFALQIKIQRWFAFFMPKMCWQDRVSLGLSGADLRCNISTLQTQYVCAELKGVGETILKSSRFKKLHDIVEKDSNGDEAQDMAFSEETDMLLRVQTPLRVLIESAGFGSLEHRGGTASYYRIESEEVEVNYLHTYWSPFLEHVTKEIAGFSRWIDLLRMPPGMKSLNERVNLELDISHLVLKIPTCEKEGKHKSPSDHIEVDVSNLVAASRAYPENVTQEQNGVQAGRVQLFTVMAKPQRPNQVIQESMTTEGDELPLNHYSVGQFSDLFIEYVAVPHAPTSIGDVDKEEGDETKASPLDLSAVIAEIERMCSHVKVELWSKTNWMESRTIADGEDAANPGDAWTKNSATTLAFNPYQLELLSRVLNNNIVGSLSTPVCSPSNADDMKVSDIEFDFADLALDLLDPLDPCVDESSSDNPSSGTAIARVCLERLQVAADGFASLRSQYRASSFKGGLWKIDWSEGEVEGSTNNEAFKSEVRALCGSIFSLSDDVSKHGVDIILDRRAPSPEVPVPPKEIRIHLDNGELLPLIVEFGQRLRYFASIESDLSEQIERAETSLDVSITTGFVHYLAAECIPNHVDDLGNEDENSQRLHPKDSTLKMIASGCIVGRYHSDEPENSRTQLYGRNMCVKVSSQWPPEPSLLVASASTPSQFESPTKTDMSGGAIELPSKYERTVCDDFTIDLELVTAEDAEATMAVTLTHFHAVICTIDLFLFSQAQKVFGTDDEGSDDNDEKDKAEATESQDGDGDSKSVEAQPRPLAPPEIEFREDSISMIELLLEDTSITLLRQSGPHLSPIARLYTFRAMCKATYEVGERIDGVVPTLTEVAVEFPDESLNEPCADDGVSIWGFNTALGSWEPIVEPWMFDLKGSLIRDETGEMTANLDFTGKEGHPLNINISPAMIDSFCLTVKAYDGALSCERAPYVSLTNIISSDCYLVNDTGAPITYWVTHDIGTASRGFTYASRRKPKRETLANRAKVPLELLTSISPSLRAEQTVSFCWDDAEWHPLTDIPIRNTGKYIYAVRPRHGATESNSESNKDNGDTRPTATTSIQKPQLLHALLDISAAAGYRTFTISSLVRLFNETNITVDCGVLEADGKTITEIGTIEPKEACSIPFRLVPQIWSVRVFMKPHLYQAPTQEFSNSKLSASPPSANREHRWSNELFISEKENSTLHTASCSLVLDDYACKCQKMIDGTVPFHPSLICKANGSYFHAQSRVFTSSNASSLQYAQLKLMSPLTLVNNCGVPIIAVLFTLKKVRRTTGATPDSEDAHIVSSQVIPPYDRIDTLSSALHDETYCSISMTGSSWSRLFRIPGVLDAAEDTTKATMQATALKAISSLPIKPGSNINNVVLSLLDFQSRTATLNVSFDSKETREKNAGHFMIVQPRFLLRNATSLPLVFSPQPKLIEKIPGTKSMMARFAKSPFSPSRKKQKEECCGSPQLEAIHSKLNGLKDQAVSEDDIDEEELQAHYYSEISAIMVQLEGNTQQSSSAQDISLEVGANTPLRVYNEATKRYHDIVALFKQVGGSSSMVVTFVERYLLLNQTDHQLVASAVYDISSAKKGQIDDKKILMAPPRSTSEFSWWAHSSIPSDTCIRIKVLGNSSNGSDGGAKDYQWSGKFSLHDVSETALKVSTPDASRICVLRVQVRVEAAVQVCVLVTNEDVAEFPLYRIINSCARETIWFKQICDGVKKDASAFQRGVMQSLAPGQSVCFGWDEAYFLGIPNREISVWYAPKDGTTSSDYHSSILLDQPGESQQVEIPSQSAIPKAPSRVYVRWHLQGLTKTMVAQDQPLNRKERAGKQTRELVAAHGETERSTTPGFTSEVVAHFRLPHFGISFVTSTPDELLLFSGQDVDIAYANINNDHDQCEVKIGCFQLDNQLSGAIYPVVVAPILKKGSGCVGFRGDASSSPDKQKSVEVRSAQGTDGPSSEATIGERSDAKRSNRPHFFHMSILRLSYDENMDYIKYFSAMMQPARVQIDEAFLLAIAAFVTDCLEAVERKYPPERRRLTSEASKVQSRGSPDRRFTTNSERRIYIETLQLHPVKIQLSITILNHYGEGEDSITGLVSLVKLPIAVTKALLSSTFSQIDSATLYLNALHLNHAFASGAFLMSTVQQHYLLQGMRQIYSLVGAADILGNPVGLVTNLGVGVKDFFYEPAAGLVTSPQEFVLGLSRGTTSLFTHSLYGAFSAASKVTGTLSEGIATLSLDRKYLAERRAQGPRKQVATHIGTGLIHGTKQLGKGIFAGVTGVITAPTQGALQGGLPGFIEGVGKGLIGVAVKPAAGVLDLAATTAAGITATTSALDRRTGLGKEVYRRREPRLLRVTSDQRVRVYTPPDALVSRLLLTLPLKFKLQLPNELYDAHIFLPSARILVATSLRLLLLEFASEGTLASLTTAIMSSTSIPPPAVLWSHALSKLVGAQRTPTGVAVHMSSSAVDAEVIEAGVEKASGDITSFTVPDLEDLSSSGCDRVLSFLTDLVVRHQRATATCFASE